MILDGIKLSQKILKEVTRDLPPGKLCLAIVQVGRNAVSKIYIQEKQKVCRTIGITCKVFLSPNTIGVRELKAHIEKIGKDPRIQGIIVQLPLPKKIPAQEVLDCIPLEKDVDVLSTKSFGLFALSKFPILPPTVAAVFLLLKEARVDPKGKHVAVVGAGRLVGLPIALWLISQGATVSVLNSSTKNLGFFTRNADIIISGVGKAKLITGAMIKKGAVVIDAGTNIEQGTTRGDVDFKGTSKKASSITKVPGGVGPLTVVYLLKNLVALSTMQEY